MRSSLFSPFMVKSDSRGRTPRPGHRRSDYGILEICKMAFDGITTAGIVRELSDTITGGGISRVIQSERDELLIVIKNSRKQHYLLMSANASLPLIYLSDSKKEAPLTAPGFCMLLRKHIQGGQILSVTQPSLERVVVLTILHRDELGDIKEKKLIIELMGKHSNIIFTDEEDTIIDSIKRVPSSVSSVREVLPGRKWFIPGTDEKTDPLTAGPETFDRVMGASSKDVVHALYNSFTGISPAAAEEFAYRAGIDPRCGYPGLPAEDKRRLADAFLLCMDDVRRGSFFPNIVLENGVPAEFGCHPFRMYSHGSFEVRTCGSVSEMIREYYGTKERVTRMRQKSSDLRHLAQTALDRTNKKFLLQEKQLKSTEKRDTSRIYGEMLNTYGYSIEAGADRFTCENYYTGEEITIPLDPTMTASENAQRYFARYNKLKRTAEALLPMLEETRSDREQLEAVLTAIDLAESEADLADIRRELQDFGFAQKKSAVKKGAKREEKSKPYSYTSSDGFLMYVGRNNYQNEEVTFRIAGNNDWWFHAKGVTGSHVIVRTEGRELPDRTFEEAGALAAYYSSARKAPKVEVDYTRRKELRKTNGGKPGFVIYHTNYSLMAVPDISKLRRNS